jgi:hypothetical protein
LKLLRKIRKVLNRFEVPFIAVAAVSGIYLAAATILSGAESPNAEFWEPWKVAFVLMLAAAVSVPLFGAYKTLDARAQAAEKRFAERLARVAEVGARLRLMCQRTVSAIADGCPDIAPNDLCVRVWRCRPDDLFEQLAFFYLPNDTLGGTTVEWRKGKGIAGTVWATGAPNGADLTPLKRQLDEIGDAAFERLEPSERWGMDAADLRKTSRYTGVCAFPLVEEGGVEVLGVLIVDYVGQGHFERVMAEASKRPVSNYVDSCAKNLTEAKGIL